MKKKIKTILAILGVLIFSASAYFAWWYLPYSTNLYDLNQDFEDFVQSVVDVFYADEDGITVPHEASLLVTIEYAVEIPYEELEVRLAQYENSDFEKILDEPAMHKYWEMTTYLLAIADKPGASDILKNIVEREEHLFFHELAPDLSEYTNKKMGALAFLGLIRNEENSDYLRKATTPEGAEEMSKDWTGKVDYHSRFLHSASCGLALTGNESDTLFLETLAADHVHGTKTLLGEIQEVGLEEYKAKLYREIRWELEGKLNNALPGTY